MKNFILILVLMTSGFMPYASAQTKIEATEGVIELTPSRVMIPSTGDYVYLAKTSIGYALFISKDSSLFKLFSSKGSDSVVRIQGAVFKPLTHYTKKQWKLLEKEIKLFFPAIAHEELEKISFYLIFNYSVEPKAASPGTTTTGSGSSPQPKGGPVIKSNR